MSVCLCVSVSQSCLTLCNPIDCSQAARLRHPWNSPGKGTGVSSHSLIQEIFLAQGSNWVSCIAGIFFSYLSHQGSPGYMKDKSKVLENYDSNCEESGQRLGVQVVIYRRFGHVSQLFNSGLLSSARNSHS